MNGHDYEKWAKFHGDIMPTYKAWWGGLKEHARSTLRHEFREIMKPVDYECAMEVSRQMLAGTIPIVPNYEMQLTVAKVAGHARQMAFDRAEPSEYEQDAKRTRPAGSPAGEMYAQILELIDQGVDPHAAAEQVIPKPAEQPTGRSYRCHKCLDSGLVTVWSNVAIRACLQGHFERHHRRVMLVGCSCSAGDQFCTQETQPRWKVGKTGRWEQSARYAPESYCRCPNGDVNNPARIAELQEWVQDYAAKRRQAPEHQRVGAFDDFNNR